MRIKMTVGVVHFEFPQIGVSSKFVGVVVTEEDYERLRDSVLSDYPPCGSDYRFITDYRELEFDVLPEMIF